MQSLERLEAGMAFKYTMKRVNEVTKLSEVDAIWTFLFNYEATKTASLNSEQLLRLRELLSMRVLRELMSESKSPSDQRYLKLATISGNFDDSMRAYDIIFSSTGGNSTVDYK